MLAVDVGIVMFLGRNQVFPIDKSSIPAIAIKCFLGSSIVCSEFQSKITDFIDTLVSAKASLIKCTFSNERQDQATNTYMMLLAA